MGLRPEGSNPCRGIRRYRRKGRERFLSDEELRRLSARLSAHADEYPGQVAVIRLLLLTGCRKGEILTLRRSDYREGHLFLRDSKTGPRTVWLSGTGPEGSRQPWTGPASGCFRRPARAGIAARAGSTCSGTGCGKRPGWRTSGFTIFAIPMRASPQAGRDRARHRPAARAPQRGDDAQIHPSRRRDGAGGRRDPRRRARGLSDAGKGTKQAHRRGDRAAAPPTAGICRLGHSRARPRGPGAPDRRDDLGHAGGRGRAFQARLARTGLDDDRRGGEAALPRAPGEPGDGGVRRSRANRPPVPGAGGGRVEGGAFRAVQAGDQERLRLAARHPSSPGLRIAAPGPHHPGTGQALVRRFQPHRARQRQQRAQAASPDPRLRESPAGISYTNPARDIAPNRRPTV